MSGPGPPEPDAGPAVEGYLAEVTTRLPGSVRARTGIVAELRSGTRVESPAHAFKATKAQTVSRCLGSKSCRSGCDRNSAQHTYGTCR